MKYRKLIDGQKVKHLETSVPMTIDSKCPQKWAFVDMETGDIWVHKSRKHRTQKCEFWGIDNKALICLKKILESERWKQYET